MKTSYPVWREREIFLTHTYTPCVRAHRSQKKAIGLSLSLPFPRRQGLPLNLALAFS